MPGLEWNTINRLSDMDLTGGLVSHVSGLGALGKGAGWAFVAANTVGQKKAAELSRTLPSSLAKLDMTFAAVQAAYQQVQDLYAQAQDLASQAQSTAALGLLDRLSNAVSAVEDSVAKAQSAYDAIPSLPRPISETEPWVGDIHDVVHNQWPAAEKAVTTTATALKAAQQQVARQVAQVAGVVKQIQAIVGKEQQTAAAAAAREAQRLAIEQARENQTLQLEQAKLAQQMQIEQARAQAELQQQMALYAPLQTPTPYTPPAAQPYGLPAAPPGYTYYDPTTGQYVGQAAAPAQAPGGPMYAPAAVSYADQPGQWAYQSPGQFMQPQGPQLPQAQPSGAFGLPQGWTSLEYDALIEGESRYLRGVAGLGAAGSTAPAQGPVTLSSATLAKLKAIDPQRAAAAAAAKSAAPSSGFGISDLTSIIDAFGQGAAKILPAFGYGPAQQAPEPPRKEIPWGTIAGVGAVIGGGLLLGAAISRSASKGRKRTYRRRSR